MICDLEWFLSETFLPLLTFTVGQEKNLLLLFLKHFILILYSQNIQGHLLKVVPNFLTTLPENVLITFLPCIILKVIVFIEREKKSSFSKVGSLIVLAGWLVLMYQCLGLGWLRNIVFSFRVMHLTLLQLLLLQLLLLTIIIIIQLRSN